MNSRPPFQPPVPPGVEISPPDETLKAKAAPPPGRAGLTREQMLNRAQRVMESFADDFPPMLRTHAAEIATRGRAFLAAPVGERRVAGEALFRAAHELKGLAGSFGFGYVTRICHSLTRVLELVRTEHPKLPALVAAQLDALDLAVRTDVRGDGSREERRVIDELSAVIDVLVDPADPVAGCAPGGLV